MLYRFLAATTLVFVTACGGGAVNNAKPRPSALIVHEGATEVREIMKDDGGYELTYNLDATFPADRVVAAIQAVFQDGRWVPLTRDWLNPGNSSGYSRGWSEFVDATKTPNTDVDVWSAEWKDSVGNLVVYSLRDDSPRSSESSRRQGPDNSALKITALYVPATAVTETRNQLGIVQALQ